MYLRSAELIKEHIEESNLTLDEIIISTGISKSRFEKIIKNQVRISDDDAKRITVAIKSLDLQYLIHYEQEYVKYLEKVINLDQEKLKKISKKFNFKQVFNGLNLDIKKQAYEMLRILKLNNYDSFDEVYSNLNVYFMEDGGQKESIAIWLNLCEEEIEYQNEIDEDVSFNKAELVEHLGIFKSIATIEELNSSLNSAKELCNSLGVNLVFSPALLNSKVRGALVNYKGVPTIYLSDRFKKHDYIWFALMHEIGYLILHYDGLESLITMEDDNYEIVENNEIETAANKFAEDFFIDYEKYKSFVERGEITKSSVLRFAALNEIHPGILVSRLQRDKIIDYSEMNIL